MNAENKRAAELLSPAGNMEKLEAALLYGADAVYLSGTEFGMRASAGNFNAGELPEAVGKAHRSGARAYVTVNILPRNADVARLPACIEAIADAGADGIIAAEPGTARMVKKYAPGVQLHISTQAGVSNYEAARAWHDMGADRIILARELSLAEIAEIHDKTPSTLALEVFVHGSMCVAYSGRCLLSAYMAGRSANAGQCAQPCRWQYALVEEKRPGEYYPVYEEDGGTYILNAKDLRMIEHIPELIKAGVASLKIEGRAKTPYYTAIITNAYRLALDDYVVHPDGWTCPPKLLEETEKVSHREYDTGFYFGIHDSQHRADSDYIRPWDIAAVVLSCDADGRALLLQKNNFGIGDRLELVTPHSLPVELSLTEMQDEDGQNIKRAPHPHMKVWTALPIVAPSGSIIRRKLG